MKVEDIKKLTEGLEISDEVLTKIEAASEKELQDAHSGVTNKTLTDVDARITQLFGIDKKDGEKTTDLIDRAAKAFKEQTTGQHKAEVANLKKEITEAKAAGANLEDLKKLQESLVEKESEVKALEDTFKSELEIIKRDSFISKVKSKIEFDLSIDKELIETYMEKADRLAREAKTVEVKGNIYVSDDGTNPTVKDGKIILFEDYASSLYSKIAKQEVPAGNGTKNSAGQTSATTPVITGAKTKLEAITAFNQQIKDMSPDEQRAKRDEYIVTEDYKGLPSD